MDHKSLRVTQNAYFSLMTHTKQLLLVTVCDTTARIGASFRTHGRRTDGRTDGMTDRRGSRNSYLDFISISRYYVALLVCTGGMIKLF